MTAVKNRAGPASLNGSRSISSRAGSIASAFAATARHGGFAIAALVNRSTVELPASLARHGIRGDFLAALCEESRQLEVQMRLHRWLHGWLFVHAPISFALLVLTAFHIWFALSYKPGG